MFFHRGVPTNQAASDQQEQNTDQEQKQADQEKQAASDLEEGPTVEVRFGCLESGARGFVDDCCLCLMYVK